MNTLLRTMDFPKAQAKAAADLLAARTRFMLATDARDASRREARDQMAKLYGADHPNPREAALLPARERMAWELRQRDCERDAGYLEALRIWTERQQELIEALQMIVGLHGAHAIKEVGPEILPMIRNYQLYPYLRERLTRIAMNTTFPGAPGGTISNA